MILPEAVYLTFTALVAVYAGFDVYKQVKEINKQNTVDKTFKKKVYPGFTPQDLKAVNKLENKLLAVRQPKKKDSHGREK